MKNGKDLPVFIYPAEDKNKHPLADYKPTYTVIDGKRYERGSVDCIVAAAKKYGHPLPDKQQNG